jgi:hypothetical protein
MLLYMDLYMKLAFNRLIMNLQFSEKKKNRGISRVEKRPLASRVEVLRACILSVSPNIRSITGNVPNTVDVVKHSTFDTLRNK